jgi:uncharacterized protein YbjQ (UPF0145 family)
MLIVTTDSLQGRNITRYLGLVTGEAILGANLFKDLFASVRDIVGGRSGAYENELAKARQVAIEEMTQEAQKLGANAIVGLNLDYESFQPSGAGGMLMVAATGTAVVLE